MNDHRATDLLSRVSEDVSLLRQDIKNLITHTSRHTLPESARDLADTAKHRLASGRQYSRAQLQSIREEPQSTILAGLALVGLLAAGVYLLSRNPSDDLHDDYEDAGEF
ncbi:MAG: hypothetical protein Q7R22_011950 [Verrucomicrobiota bacterium JB025]|nr:hypothetical protein [Verrucomicrobiota bacterium JB025]